MLTNCRKLASEFGTPNGITVYAGKRLGSQSQKSPSPGESAAPANTLLTGQALLHKWHSQYDQCSPQPREEDNSLAS